MDAAASETTRDWLLPDRARPPLIGELERRVDEALAIARSSEAAVMTVGAAAFDAAEQARRAAGHAEEASAAALAALPVPQEPPPHLLEPVPTTQDEAGLGDFHARADHLAARLKELQRLPLAGERDVESPR